jgi:class 3 adenylate cyclase
MDHPALRKVTLDTQRRHRARRRLLRIAIPVACVIVMLGAILIIAALSYHHNRRDALALSDDLLALLKQRVEMQVKDYLVPASKLPHIAAGLLRDQDFGGGLPALIEPLALHILETYPQLAMFYVANPQGHFTMGKRMPDGSIHTKMIVRSDAGVETTWRRRNSQGEITGVETVSDETYDPRVRPWYRGAVEKQSLYWSDIYIFFTDQKPGMTISLPIRRGDGDLLGVVGLDIALEHLSAFLASLKIGQHGRAMIVDEHGRLVAYPDLSRTFKQVGDQLHPAALETLNDLVLTRAFNRLRIEGEGHRQLDVEGQRYISAAASLRLIVGRHWSVLIVARESDFVGFVAKNNRRALMMSLGIVGLTSLLATLLMVQGLRADRNAQLVLDRQHQLEAQSRAFAALASQAALFDPEDEASLAKLTEIACDAVDVRRVSLWTRTEGGTVLICDDCYDRDSDGHTRGVRLARYDLSPVFEVLDQGGELAVIKADDDPRTAELHRVYLHPFGCQALLAAPIVHQGMSVGSIWFEDERRVVDWSPEILTFARALASMLALRLTADVRSEARVTAGAAVETLEGEETLMPMASAPPVVGSSVAPRQAMRRTTIAPDRTTVFMARLAARGLDQKNMGAHVFADTTVLVIQLTDPLALAERLHAENTRSIADHLVCTLEDLAAAHGMEYLKIMSDEIVCAAGFADDPNHGARVILDVALELQARCIRLFVDLHTRMEFRIGVDTGAVIGSPIGREGHAYNLWGEAARVAKWMAETGIAGAIQVSESTYQRMRDRYLFSVRGAYYLQDVGELSTYILMGRI